MTNRYLMERIHTGYRMTRTSTPSGQSQVIQPESLEFTAIERKLLPDRFPNLVKNLLSQQFL